MFFWNSLALFYVPVAVGNLISCSSVFSKSGLNIWEFSVHILLKPLLENFQHLFASMWKGCNCAVVSIFFGIAFLGIGMSPKVLWPLPSFPNLLAYWVQHFHRASSFRIWNSSTGIPSPPLALFVMMLPKDHLTWHSRMSGSRWVITLLRLSGSLRFFFLYSPSVYSWHLFCFC